MRGQERYTLHPYTPPLPTGCNRRYADYFKWALLGLCILVAFALIAEIYLVCGCKRDKQDEPWRLTPSVAPRLVSTNSRTVLARSLSV